MCYWLKKQNDWKSEIICTITSDTMWCIHLRFSSWFQNKKKLFVEFEKKAFIVIWLKWDSKLKKLYSAKNMTLFHIFPSIWQYSKTTEDRVKRKLLRPTSHQGAAVRRFSVKRNFLTNLGNFSGKYLGRIFFNKVTGWLPAISLKKRLRNF